MRFARSLSAVVITLVVITGIGVPAFAAGTLTGASFTAATPYAYTRASNARYDYGFTTASSATLSRVSATVPAGTDGPYRYLQLPGINGNFASTPNSLANSVTGDIDIRVKVALASWTPSSGQGLVSKWSGATSSNYGYALYMNSGGTPVFSWSPDGSTRYYLTGNAMSYTAGTTAWLRATLVSSSKTVTLWTSFDGINWTSNVSNGAGTAIFANSTALQVGSLWASGASATNGHIFFASVASTVTGSVTTSLATCSSTGVVACFNPNDATAAQAHAGTWTSTSPQSETWTVNGNGTNLPADIATDLSPSQVTGLPSGGTANYRFIDGTANYYLPSATSIPAGTPCTVSLQGFTNTATAGSYPSTISTYDNSATPVLIDSATTGTLAFTDDASSAVVGTTVDPTLAFTVGAHSGACNGLTPTGTSGPTSVNLGHLTSASPVSGAQDLSVSANAAGGFTVYLRGGPLSGPRALSNVSGTSASPAAFGAGEGFGYTLSDTHIAGFAGPLFAALTSTNAPVMTNLSGVAVPTATNCVAYQAQVTPSTPAGAYATTVTYTAVPFF